MNSFFLDILSGISSVLNSCSCLYLFLSETLLLPTQTAGPSGKNANVVSFFVYCHRCKELFEIAPIFPGTILLEKTEYLLFKISLKFYHYYCALFAVGVKLHILCLLHEYIYNDFEYHRSGNFGNLLFYLLFKNFFFFWMRNTLDFLRLHSKHYCLLF